MKKVKVLMDFAYAGQIVTKGQVIEMSKRDAYHHTNLGHVRELITPINRIFK